MTLVYMLWLSMTRWRSRIDAFKPFAKRPREVLAALKHALENLDLTSEQLSQAKVLNELKNGYHLLSLYC